MIKQKKETVEEFMQRGGNVTIFKPEHEWPMFSHEERIKFDKVIRTLDYERDYSTR